MDVHGYRSGLFIIVGGVVASLFLVAVARKLYTKKKLLESHDLTGNLLSVVGTLYAVLLGLVVVDALARFEQAVDVVQQESNSLADIFLLADRLPDPQRTSLRECCKTYARQVVDEEWPLMRRGLASDAARRTAFELSRALDGFEPAAESHKAVFPMILEQVRQLWDCRRERLGTARHGIPVVEWVVLVVGGGITSLFGGLFCARSVSLQRLLTVLTAMLFGLNLYLVALFGYPFAGEVTVSSSPFATDIAIFEGRGDGAGLPE